MTTSQSGAGYIASRPGPDLVKANVLRRLEEIGPARFATLVILAYVVLSLFAYLPAWPGDPHRLVGCACGDPAEQAWYLGWVPWAIVHGHNPLFTSWMDYPSGVNLAVNTEMPLLGLVTAPITFFFGPVSSFTFMLWLAYPLSATSAFFVLRYWTGSQLAGACGGLLYGFSAYVVGQGLGHLNLSFVPLPPLIFLALHEIIVRQRGRPLRWGVILGLLAAAQFLISAEILFTTGMVSLLGVVILALARPRLITRSRLQLASRALLPAAVIAGGLVSYPLYFQLAGPLRIKGPAQGTIMNPFRADLLGPFVPTFLQRFSPAAAVRLGNSFTDYQVDENGSYLGIPLVLLAVWCVARFRRDRWVLLAACLALASFVLSLGPRLVVAAHETAIPLPFDLIGPLPLVQDVLPVRLSQYQSFFVAVVVAFGIAHWLAGDDHRAPPGLSDRDTRQERRLVHFLAPFVLALLAVSTVVSLIPSWPLSTADVSTTTPSFFVSSAASEVPSGSVVLTYPFPVYSSNAAMLWQEIDLWRWKLIGGYAAIPNATGAVTALPPPLSPIAVQEFLGYWTMDNPYIVAVPPPLDARLVAEMRSYVLAHRVGTVILDTSWPRAATVYPLFERALGRPATVGGVDLWLHAQERVAEGDGLCHPDCSARPVDSSRVKAP